MISDTVALFKGVPANDKISVRLVLITETATNEYFTWQCLNVNHTDDICLKASEKFRKRHFPPSYNTQICECIWWSRDRSKVNPTAQIYNNHVACIKNEAQNRVCCYIMSGNKTCMLSHMKLINMRLINISNSWHLNRPSTHDQNITFHKPPAIQYDAVELFEAIACIVYFLSLLAMCFSHFLGLGTAPARDVINHTPPFAGKMFLASKLCFRDENICDKRRGGFPRFSRTDVDPKATSCAEDCCCYVADGILNDPRWRPLSATAGGL